MTSLPFTNKSSEGFAEFQALRVPMLKFDLLNLLNL